jgi:hypothetical protein
MKAKSTLDDFLNAQAIRMSWLRAMHECRKNNRMLSFMYAQLNFLYWDNEFSLLFDKHIGEMMDLVRLARWGKS